MSNVKLEDNKEDTTVDNSFKPLMSNVKQRNGTRERLNYIRFNCFKPLMSNVKLNKEREDLR